MCRNGFAVGVKGAYALFGAPYLIHGTLNSLDKFRVHLVAVVCEQIRNRFAAVGDIKAVLGMAVLNYTANLTLYTGGGKDRKIQGKFVTL